MTKPTTASDGNAIAGLRAGDRVCVVAGSGRLPVDVAAGLVAAGFRPYVVMVEGEVVPASSLAQYDHHVMKVGEFPSLPSALAKRGIRHLVLAGGVSRRPSLREIPVTLSLLRILPSVLRGLARGDDGMLKILIGVLERQGLTVIGAHEIVPDLLATSGAMTRARPGSGDQADLAAALTAARAIGALDIGQGAVAIGGRVVALEGAEGTEGLLERVATMRSTGRLAAKRRGVLVKCAKPAQELRVDLPTIGPATVEQAHAAGLAGIGVEAGKSLVLDHGRMVERADALGLFVVGLPSEGVS